MKRRTWLALILAVALAAVAATVGPALAHGPEDGEAPAVEGWHGWGMHGGHHMGTSDPVTLERIAGVLGLTLNELSTRLADGETIAEIAEEVRVDVSLVVSTILAPQAEVLQVMVKYGYLTTEEAEAMLQQMELMIGQVITAETIGHSEMPCEAEGMGNTSYGRWSGGDRGHGGMMSGGMMGRGMMGAW